jgi:hypothetical protein
VFSYFNCFPDYEEMVAVDVGYDLCFVKADAAFGSVECSATTDC